MVWIDPTDEARHKPNGDPLLVVLKTVVTGSNAVGEISLHSHLPFGHILEARNYAVIVQRGIFKMTLAGHLEIKLKKDFVKFQS